ncbi:MAG: hypothetical protein R6U61_08335 [Thermoplasmata archaeon]
MDMIYTLVSVCLAGLAILQAMVGFSSYRRSGSKKLLLITLTFVIFGAIGIYALLSRLFSIAPLGEPNIFMLSLDLLIVVLLYLAILRK